MKDHSAEWAENLPPSCPPSCAQPPDGQVFYRLVSSNPPTGSDFLSVLALRPEIPVRDPCIGKALSVFSDRAEALRHRTFPTLRDKRWLARIVLTPEAGKIKQTGNTQAHYSWWCYREYNPVEHCELSRVDEPDDVL